MCVSRTVFVQNLDFEVEILTVGNSNANPRFGIRMLAEPNDVGALPTDLGISYVNNAFNLVDGSTNIAGLTPTGLGTVIVGTVFQIAVDWDTGKWWMGKDDTLGNMRAMDALRASAGVPVE